MFLHLRTDLQQYFSEAPAEAFQRLMTLEGDCVRAQEGRMTKRILMADKYYYIKQHNGVGWREILKNLLQLRLPVTSAANEWQAILRLQQLNVAVANIAAYGTKGINPAAKQSFILMEEIAPTISLETLTQSWKQQPPNWPLKQFLLAEVARITATLHMNGINHRDLYICHFLWDKRQKLYLIDLHRAQMRGRTPQRWIIKDLAGLYFSSKDIGLTRRDYFRFMKLYSGKSLRQTLLTEKAFWQKVVARGEKLYCKH